MLPGWSKIYLRRLLKIRLKDRRPIIKPIPIRAAMSSALGIEKLQNRNCISTAAIFCSAKINTTMISSNDTIDLILYILVTPWPA